MKKAKTKIMYIFASPEGLWGAYFHNKKDAEYSMKNSAQMKALVALGYKLVEAKVTYTL